MKRVKRRAGAALLIAGAVILGLCIYIVRFLSDGSDWAAFRANQSVYSGGVLDTGTLTDRNGQVLAHAGGGVYYYADDALTRLSSFHVVGDYGGNIGTGAISAFAPKLVGYSAVKGTYGDGDTVALTIDASLCTVAYNALAGRKGAVLVYNYRTGEVLCMVSTPSYDPNNPPDLSSNSGQYEGVYLNRAISSTYTPGSVFKLVTAAAAIENIDNLFTRSFYCGGSVIVDGTRVNCTGTHGEQTIEEALANSCNCAFSELSLELGGDLLFQYAEALGMTSSYKLSGIETAAGRFEAAAAMADLAWSGIGQYTDLVSPYAMLRLSGAIAGGGKLVEPRLLMSEKSMVTELMPTDTAGKLADMMEYNVAYGYGAGSFPGLDVCAKTGTAEVGDGASHAWFTGFLDDSEHPYAFAVIVERGGSGLTAAGGVANTVLQAAVE